MHLKLSCLLACIFSTLLAFFLLPAAGQAHGPEGVSLAYSSDSGILTVTILHAVSNPDKHYIKEVVLRKNGEVLAIYRYTGQSASSPFSYEYPVEAKVGDRIEATAECNYYGSGEGGLNISEQPLAD